MLYEVEVDGSFSIWTSLIRCRPFVQISFKVIPHPSLLLSQQGNVLALVDGEAKSIWYLRQAPMQRFFPLNSNITPSAAKILREVLQNVGICPPLSTRKSDLFPIQVVLDISVIVTSQLQYNHYQNCLDSHGVSSGRYKSPHSCHCRAFLNATRPY